MVLFLVPFKARCVICRIPKKGPEFLTTYDIGFEGTTPNPRESHGK